MRKREHFARLAWREYVPLLCIVAMWSLILLALGHADTARLFAATLMVRAIQMLTRLSTAPSLKARIGAEPAIQKRARRLALFAQGVGLCIALLLVAFLMLGLRQIDQGEIAAFVPLIAIGMPAKILRNTDTRTDSPYFRLALAGGGLAAASFGWAVGWHAVGMGLAFGAREWIAYAALRLWPKPVPVPKRPTMEPLDWSEIARNSALSARRLITYRITKIALTVFGPVGNFAARTGRGLNWHSRIEPYLPHRFSGFLLFILGTGGTGVFLAARSGEPAAMVAAGGLFQLAAASANILLMWRYLPNRDDPNLIVDDDDE